MSAAAARPAVSVEDVLAAHEKYEWWPMTREFICTCEASLGKSYPDPAHRAHVAAALAEAGVGDVAEARAEGAQAVLDAVVEAAPRLNSELRHDGTADPIGAAYVEAFHDAWSAARAAAAEQGAS